MNGERKRMGGTREVKVLSKAEREWLEELDERRRYMGNVG
jgi:hypothetical protein